MVGADLGDQFVVGAELGSRAPALRRCQVLEAPVEVERIGAVKLGVLKWWPVRLGQQRLEFGPKPLGHVPGDQAAHSEGLECTGLILDGDAKLG